MDAHIQQKTWELEKQLAVEREKREQAEAMMLDAYDKAKMMRDELDTLVEALKEVKPSVKQLYGKGSVSTIDAALAKIGGK